jgi:hypothetical protein
MSNSKLHKDIGRWKNTNININIRLRKFFNRSNFDFSELKEREIGIKEKIAENETKNQIIEIE